MPPSSIRLDLLISAVFWGILAGLGEGICWFLAGSLVWREHLRAAVIWDSTLFLLVVLLAQLSSRRLHPSTRTVALFVLSWLVFWDWASTLWPDVAVVPLLLGVTLLSSILIFRMSVKMDEIANLQRRVVPVLVLLALACMIVIPWRARAHEQREEAVLVSPPPGAASVIMVIEDTVRADHLSTYGYARPTSPNLTELAQQGALFENAVATSSWTLPSHASMMTGLYPHEHHAVTDFDQHHADTEFPTLGSGYHTLGEEMMARGYRTAAFSANTEVFTRERGFGSGFIHFEDDFQNWRTAFARSYYGHLLSDLLFRIQLQWHPYKVGRVQADAINQRALRWMDEQQGHTFLVVLNYFDAHDPYLPPDPYLHRFSSAKNPGRFSSRLHPTQQQLRDATDAYDGALQYVDSQLGNLVSELRKRGLANNCLLIVTSDHGEAFGEHGFVHHGNALYRELIHVPLVFWEPGKIPTGRRVTEPVSLASLPSTVLQQVGTSGSNPFPMPSLAQLWQYPGGAPSWPAPVSELSQLNWSTTFPNYYGPMLSITTSEWRYVVGGKYGEQLFPCCSNLPETENQARSASGQRVCRGFRNELFESLFSLQAKFPTYRDQANFKRVWHR